MIIRLFKTLSSQQFTFIQRILCVQNKQISTTLAKPIGTLKKAMYLCGKSYEVPQILSLDPSTTLRMTLVETPRTTR